MRSIQSCLSSVLALLFPARCAACDALGAEPFCDGCAETLVSAPPGCSVCGVPLDDSLEPPLKPRRCGPCRAHAPPFASARAPFLHGGALAEAIHALKYEHREELARPLGALFEAVERPRADLVCPLPLHTDRLMHRGYDQAELLAREASRRFSLPLQHVLVRARPTAPQVGSDRRSRARNVSGAFRATGDVRGRSICLIDDVLTTGATAGEAARALYAAGARRVEVRTLSRAP